MRKYIYSFTGLVLFITSQSAGAFVGLCCGKCGGNMPLNIPGAGIPETKEFRVKISPMTMSMEGLLDGTKSVSTASVLGSSMAAPTAMTMNMVNITAGYSFTDKLFGGVMFMYKKNTMDMEFGSMMTMATGNSGFTMKSSGFSDVMLMGKYQLYADDPLIPSEQSSLFFGLSLPTGSINERNKSHPLPPRQTELLPYGMQLGSGSYDPSIGFVYSASKSPLWWGVNAIETLRLQDNDNGYRLGNEFKLDMYSIYQFKEDVLAEFQLNYVHAGKISGEMDEYTNGTSGRAMKGNTTSSPMSPLWDTDNYGGEKLLATVGFQYQPVPLQVFELSVGMPIYQNLNGPQLEESYRLTLSWYVELPTKASIRHKEHSSKNGKLGF